MNIFLSEYIIGISLLWRCFLFCLSLFLLHLLFGLFKLLRNVNSITDWRQRYLGLFLYINISRTFLPEQSSVRFSTQT
jgi:hypothetical protein